nr:hypothetical protein [Vibrio cholerae]
MRCLYLWAESLSAIEHCFSLPNETAICLSL